MGIYPGIKKDVATILSRCFYEVAAFLLEAKG